MSQEGHWAGIQVTYVVLLTPSPFLALQTKVIFAFVLITSNLSEMIRGVRRPCVKSRADPGFPSGTASARSQFGRKTEQWCPDSCGAAVGWTRVQAQMKIRY